MTKQAIIERTIKIINQLPESKAEEISDFADYLIKRYEEQSITEGIKSIISESESFDFLNREEELYTTQDLKKVFGE